MLWQRWQVPSRDNHTHSHISRWQNHPYLSKPIVLEQPTCIGYLQRVPSFNSLPFSKKEILVKDWIEHWGAVALSNAHLQKEGLSASLAIKWTGTFHYNSLQIWYISYQHWSSPDYSCIEEVFHAPLCWILLSYVRRKYPLLYRSL